MYYIKFFLSKCLFENLKNKEKELAIANSINKHELIKSKGGLFCTMLVFTLGKATLRTQYCEQFLRNDCT